MGQIISINTAVIGEEEVNSVNARDLYTALEIKKDFSEWIKTQIKSLNLEKNIDFIATPLKRGIANGGYKTIIEYILTIDAAKHIAMASRTKKGKEVRAYFIEVEKNFKIGIGQYKALKDEKLRLERKYYRQLEISNKLLLEKLEKKDIVKKQLIVRKEWNSEDEQRLIELVELGYAAKDIAKELDRTPDSIRSRKHYLIKKGVLR